MQLSFALLAFFVSSALCQTSPTDLLDGINKYKSGKYELAVTALRKFADSPALSAAEKNEALKYIAASYYKLGLSSITLDLFKSILSNDPGYALSSDVAGAGLDSLFQQARQNLPASASTSATAGGSPQGNLADALEGVWQLTAFGNYLDPEVKVQGATINGFFLDGTKLSGKVNGDQLEFNRISPKFSQVYTGIITADRKSASGVFTFEGKSYPWSALFSKGAGETVNITGTWNLWMDGQGTHVTLAQSGNKLSGTFKDGALVKGSVIGSKVHFSKLGGGKSFRFEGSITTSAPMRMEGAINETQSHKWVAQKVE